LAVTPPYENDALRYAAVEVRFPIADDGDPQHLARIRDAVREDLPVAQEEQQIGLALGMTGPSTQQTVRQRLSTRDRLTSAVLGRDGLALETTSYPGWTEFRDNFMRLLQALAEVRQPDGILRVGLRYIDEIRVPSVEAFADWDGWVSDRLLAPLGLDDEAGPSAATIALQYGTPPGFVTTFRAAPFSSGRTVQEEGPLRVPFSTPDGPYFMLDTDASWVDPDRQVPEFDVGAIVDILDQLHDPAHRLFEASITEQLRNDVLRRPREEVWGERDD
jgi:uncharacterized protein (TIGR04255 family)